MATRGAEISAFTPAHTRQARVTAATDTTPTTAEFVQFFSELWSIGGTKGLTRRPEHQCDESL